MSLGALIRDLRKARGWSQSELARRLAETSGRPSLTREEISRWERATVIPGPYWLSHLSTVLGAPADLLAEEARLSRVNRRTFLSLATLTAVHGKLATEMAAGIAGRDPGPLTSVQTTHGTDMVIASMVDRSSATRLRRWMRDGAEPVLRVNAAGILAKLPDQHAAMDVALMLTHDEQARQLYQTAVLSRVCALDWQTARCVAAQPTTLPVKKIAFVATRLAGEVLNPRDAGARWCSAAMLRDLSPLLR
ncbi:MAG: helix-turn-helix transcriptional regulator [Actinobacteria bacterium]|nr:helix-turn-helix transcriptional regulator [Actinomycetota bacterium]